MTMTIKRFKSFVEAANDADDYKEMDKEKGTPKKEKEMVDDLKGKTPEKKPHPAATDAQFSGDRKETKS